MSLGIQLSLSRRLLAGLVTVTFVYWAVIAVLTVRDSVDDVYELFDVHLAQTALALLRVTDPDDNDPQTIPAGVDVPSLGELFNTSNPPTPVTPGRGGGSAVRSGAVAPGAVVAGSLHSMHQAYEKRLRYQVWSGTGGLLLRSANAPEVAMAVKDGYSESVDEGAKVWRHFAVWDRHHDFRIVVSEEHDLRTQLMRKIVLHIASPLALGLPFLVLLLWFSIRAGLQPLNVLTREIGSRKAENLAPLDVEGVPREVLPMVQALNALLVRVDQALEGERRFTANAAHELRTPLAAIQAQMHGVRSADTEAERQQAIARLQEGVERSIRLVGQMLTLARLDPEQQLPDPQPVDLGDVAQTVCAELAPLALQRRQEMELNVQDSLPSISGNPDMLCALVRNLVDNAIRYTPDAGHIEINVQRHENCLLLQVRDDGPGIAPAQREQVFARFYRLAGHDQPGTGLGLSICRRIAELHKTRITLDDGLNGQGVCVSVCIPLP